MKTKKILIFKFTDNIQYRIVFLKEGIGVEKPQLLYLDEINFGENAGEGFFSAVNNSEVDTNRVLGFKDVYNLELNHKEIYDGLFAVVENYLSDNDEESVPSLLGIHPETEIKTGLGVSSRDNSDYLAFARLNESHWYPKKEVNSGFSRRETVRNLRCVLTSVFHGLVFRTKFWIFSWRNEHRSFINRTSFEFAALSIENAFNRL